MIADRRATSGQNAVALKWVETSLDLAWEGAVARRRIFDAQNKDRPTLSYLLVLPAIEGGAPFDMKGFADASIISPEDSKARRRTPNMGATKSIDISTVINSNKISGAQIAVVALCGLALIIDGMDAQAMGYVAPALIKAWNIPKPILGPVFSAGLLGMLFGSLAFSMVADKVGRRPVLMGSTLFFGVLTFLLVYASSVTELLVLRFLAGLGLGCIMPNSLALAGEFLPKRIRVTLMMLISCGFIAGGMLGGVVSAALIPVFGWQSVFVVGGGVPVIISALMFFFLPESLHFMVIRGGRTADLAKWLRRISPSLEISDQTKFTDHDDRQKGAGIPVFHLFREGRAVVTILLWLINFANLLDVYFLANWLPTVSNAVGYSMSQSILAGTAMWGGGIIGSLMLGWLIDRLNFGVVLVPTFVLTCVTIALIGHPAITPAVVPFFIVIFLAGFAVNGGQAGLNSFAAVYYPTAMRSTGVGWGLGIGRIGSVLGPVLGGALIAMNSSTGEIFLVLAVPAAVSTCAMMIIWLLTRRQTHWSPTKHAEAQRIYP